MAQNPSGIEVKGVTVTYSSGVKALDNASFSTPAGSITALVGINGAGKSTLFKAIMGFAPTASGSITINGQSVKDALRQNMVAYVPQSEEIDWDFPVLVRDVVMMGRYGYMGFTRRAAPRDHEAVKSALERVSLADLAERQIGELSGGQRKRVFLARALAQESKVVLLDEPFTGVDVKTEAHIIDVLRQIRDEKGVVLVSTHNLGSVPEFCDRAVLMRGTVLRHGPTAEVFTKSNLEHAFGGVLRRITLEGGTLHDDEDTRAVTILTDDERPFVQYGDQTQTAQDEKP